MEVQGILRKPVHCHRNTNIGELRSQVAKATGLGPEHTRLMGAGELTCLAIEVWQGPLGAARHRFVGQASTGLQDCACRKPMQTVLAAAAALSAKHAAK